METGMIKRNLWVLVTLFTLAFPFPGRADTLFGEFQRLPDEIERGFSIGADFGLLTYVGDKGAIKNPGFQLTFTTGYDLTHWLSLEGIYTLGLNEISALATPTTVVRQGGGINTFQGNLAVKGELPLGRFFPFLELGPGIVYTRPDYFGENKKLSVLAAFGIEYYTLLRHYSLYVKGTYTYVQLPIDQISVAAGLKYTF
jgi:hypothetical protein